MSIPFTQYLRPHGHKILAEINMPDYIEAAAWNFIDCGGWFDIQELITGDVSMTARFIIDNEPQDIAIRICKNGPPVVKAVEELVLEVDKIIREAKVGT